VSLPRMLTGACALLATLVVAGPAYAGALNETIPLDFDNVNPCTGEPFHYSQNWHIVAQEVTTPDGEISVSGQHVNSEKTTGVGLLTGDRYEVNEIINTIDHPRFDAAHPFTGETQFHVIDTGSGDDFFIDEVFHETVNANGDITVAVENGSVRCGNDNTHVHVNLA
jgi:hypothetical protein